MQGQELRVLASSLPFSSPEEMKPLLAAGMGMEIFLDMPGWDDEAAVEGSLYSLRTIYGNFPLSIHASMADDLDLSDFPGAPAQQKALTVFRRTLKLAGRLGALHVVIHTHGYQRLIPDDIRLIRQWRVKHFLQILAGWARQAGTKAVVENIGTDALGTLLFREEEYLKLFEEIPGIYSLVDVGHAFLNGWDVPDLLARLDQRLVALHLHDNHGTTDEHLPIGRGSIDWPAVAAVLRARGDHPALVLEYEKEPAEQSLGSLLQGGRLVHSWWTESGAPAAGRSGLTINFGRSIL